jgi:hypothetical protein
VNKGGISIQTLLISSLSAVAAAVVVPLIWDRGTLVATAMTPVIVALTSEALRRPAEKITAATPKVARRSATGVAVRAPEHFEPLPPDKRDRAPEVREDDPFGLRAAPRPPRRHWQVAAVTGIAAFVIAVLALTGSELVFGGPATKSGGRTTFFGSKATPTATPSPTATPADKASPTPTPTPSETVAPTVTASPTPTPSVESAPDTATPSPTP